MGSLGFDGKSRTIKGGLKRDRTWFRISGGVALGPGFSESRENRHHITASYKLPLYNYLIDILKQLRIIQVRGDCYALCKNLR